MRQSVFADADGIKIQQLVGAKVDVLRPDDDAPIGCVLSMTSEAEVHIDLKVRTKSI